MNVSQEIISQRNLSNGRKTKSVIKNSEDGFELFMSGAPEEVFNSCHDISENIKKELNEQTSKGRRVIAVS